MDWELFLDESGDFDAGKPCLIGGFLCPDGKMNSALAKSWKHDILSIECVQRAISNFGNWQYDHCRDNSCHTNTKKVKRGIVQKTILEEYVKKIESIGGKLVVFDNPKGVFNIDNTTNFLTVMAKGLMMLFYNLRDNELSSLKVHCASRRNNTRQDHPQELAVSPTNAEYEGLQNQGTILSAQYMAQLRNLAFLQGGQWLLENKAFSSILSQLDIIYDDYVITDKTNADYTNENGTMRYTPQKGNYEKRPNPVTVICDYVCNTLMKSEDFGKDEQNSASIRDLYSPNHCLYYSVDMPLQNDNDKHENYENADGLISELIRLISTDFPEPRSSAYFAAFNKASNYNQHTAISATINALYQQVYSQHNMSLTIERLEHAVQKAALIENHNSRTVFITNLLLYQQALYTHLGNMKRVNEIREKTSLLIETIQDGDEKDRLLDIADNRYIVNLTDSFDYRTAMTVFHDIEKYWDGKISFAKRRSSNMQFPIYGRILGSYLQLARHCIHSSTGEDKEIYYLEALERAEKARIHCYEVKDISRFHQTMCDIEAEMSHWDKAFSHLFCASLDSDTLVEFENSTIQMSQSNIEQILGACGVDGQINPYLLQHYVRLLSTMYSETASTRCGELMAGAIIPYVDENYGSTVNSIHPRTQIQWKTASFIAYRTSSSPKEKQIASVLYEKASKEMLLQKEAIFAAIATVVRVEHLFHVVNKRLNGNPAAIERGIQQAYKLYEELMLINAINPFKSFVNNGVLNICRSSKVDEFRCLLSIIGY